MQAQTLYNTDDIKKYWEMSLPNTLGQEETIRVVSQVREADGSYGKFGVLTLKQPFRTPADLSKLLDQLQRQNSGKQVGISISTAVFNFTNEPPKMDSFKYSNAIAIDIDTHIGNTKDRYVLGELEESQIKVSLIKTWVEISKKFQEFGIGVVQPKASVLTGGGLQYIIEFERPLNKYEAQKIYGLLKNSIGDLKWKTVLMDILGNYSAVAHDIDKSFADLVHVQRCAGTNNQKYNIMSRFINLFEMSEDELNTLKNELRDEMDLSGYTEEQKEAYKVGIEKDFKDFYTYRATAVPKLEIENNLITATMQSTRTFIKPSELKSIEYDLLNKLKQAKIDALDLLQGFVRVGYSSGNLTKLYCPFHEETNPSMAFYRNELFDTFKDFHDDASYSLITFWQKLFQVGKSTAISQISEKAGINLGKTERKEFQNLEIQEIIEVLVSEIDTENFVYYRLANKNRTCVVRHINTGEAFIFDGPKMLANHILQNQLKRKEIELKLQEEFGKLFQERVLIDAFESFEPGEPTVFSKQFVKFVNLWVSSDKYKRVQARVKELDDTHPESYKIEETKELLKKKCPFAYKYVLQMVQNGDLTWFLNWLINVAHFKTMPTVPVIFGVQGAGKNLFVNTVMDFYLNNEYVKVVSGDRIMQQFNSMLESTSLLVLDEGDFSTGKEVDQLKLLSGNDKILIEKKGVDATNKTRHFNILFFSNGEVPLRHPAMDRRITYFNNEISLLASCESWGFTIDDFVERVKSEMVDFWAYIYKTEVNQKMAMANSKNGQFWKQILLQHPFGSLVVKLMNNEWESVALQLNEGVQDPAELKANLELLQTIKQQFESTGKVSLTLINRYLHSLNFKMKQSIQKFIEINHLPEFGITISVETDDVKISINKRKVQQSLKIKNVLKAAYPKTAKEEVSSLEAELAMEQTDAGVEAEQEAEYEIGHSLVPPPPPNLGA